MLAAWQGWAPDAPDALAASLLVTAGQDPRSPRRHVFGAMPGTAGDARAARRVRRPGRCRPATSALQRAAVPARPSAASPSTTSGRRPPGRAPASSKSEFFRRALPAGAIAALLDFVAAGRSREARVLDFSPWGGAYNRVDADATAFAHRAERFLLKHDVAVAPRAATPSARRARLARPLLGARPPVGLGRRLSQLPRPGARGLPAAYHGANLDRLDRVKPAYDPGNVFRSAQSLPVDPEARA